MLAQLLAPTEELKLNLKTTPGDSASLTADCNFGRLGGPGRDKRKGMWTDLATQAILINRCCQTRPLPTRSNRCTLPVTTGVCHPPCSEGGRLFEEIGVNRQWRTDLDVPFFGFPGLTASRPKDPQICHQKESIYDLDSSNDPH